MIKLKGVIEEDFVQYKEPTMVLMFPFCTFKCDKENGCNLCQNSDMALAPDINVNIKKLIERYITNPITKGITCSGLEPFDSEIDLYNLISIIRLEYGIQDVIVIYTGYTEKEIKERFALVYNFTNIIIKYGRFIPDKEPHIDEVLGVSLVSPNQYAKQY